MRYRLVFKKNISNFICSKIECHMRALSVVHEHSVAVHTQIVSLLAEPNLTQNRHCQSGCYLRTTEPNIRHASFGVRLHILRPF